jgi:hypothetical protein
MRNVQLSSGVVQERMNSSFADVSRAVARYTGCVCGGHLSTLLCGTASGWLSLWFSGVTDFFPDLDN